MIFHSFRASCVSEGFLIMKKTHILFIICSIAMVGGVLLSIHENFKNKSNNWD